MHRYQQGWASIQANLMVGLVIGPENSVILLFLHCPCEEKSIWQILRLSWSCTSIEPSLSTMQIFGIQFTTRFSGISFIRSHYSLLAYLQRIIWSLWLMWPQLETKARFSMSRINTYPRTWLSGRDPTFYSRPKDTCEYNTIGSCAR